MSSLLSLVPLLVRAFLLVALVLFVRFAVRKQYTVLFTEPGRVPGNYHQDLAEGLGLLVTLQETPSLVGLLFGRTTVVTRWHGSNLHWIRSGDNTVIRADSRQQAVLNRHWADHTVAEHHLALLERADTRALPERTG